ncbi:hypothetical protein AeRB84_016212 [Aphanomyces euteiches]|nr:hypothetical protein AeRB84_016212 [Aphanomyces euteiches]
MQCGELNLLSSYDRSKLDAVVLCPTYCNFPSFTKHYNRPWERLATVCTTRPSLFGLQFILQFKVFPMRAFVPIVATAGAVAAYSHQAVYDQDQLAALQATYDSPIMTPEEEIYEPLAGNIYDPLANNIDDPLAHEIYEPLAGNIYNPLATKSTGNRRKGRKSRRVSFQENFQVGQTMGKHEKRGRKIGGKVGGIVGGAIGGGAGAAAGGAVGSLAGPVGTAFGSKFGMTVGAAAGASGGKRAGTWLGGKIGRQVDKYKAHKASKSSASKGKGRI